MSLLAWIVLGLVAGLIVSKIINNSGAGLVLDIVLGVVGAVLGGWCFTNFGLVNFDGLNPYSFLIAIAGAMAALVTYHYLVRSARYLFANKGESND